MMQRKKEKTDVVLVTVRSSWCLYVKLIFSIWSYSLFRYFCHIATLVTAERGNNICRFLLYMSSRFSFQMAFRPKRIAPRLYFWDFFSNCIASSSQAESPFQRCSLRAQTVGNLRWVHSGERLYGIHCIAEQYTSTSVGELLIAMCLLALSAALVHLEASSFDWYPLLMRFDREWVGGKTEEGGHKEGQADRERERGNICSRKTGLVASYCA